MTEQEYLIAWAVYAIAALLLLVVSFKATGWLWRWLREPIRLVVAVLLVTPALVDAEHGLYAPAIAVTVLDLVFKVGNSAWSAVANLAAAGTIGVVLYNLEEAGLASQASAVAIVIIGVVTAAMLALDALGKYLPAGALPWQSERESEAHMSARPHDLPARTPAIGQLKPKPALT